MKRIPELRTIFRGPSGTIEWWDMMDHTNPDAIAAKLFAIFDEFRELTDHLRGDVHGD